MCAKKRPLFFSLSLSVSVTWLSNERARTMCETFWIKFESFWEDFFHFGDPFFFFREPSVLIYFY